MTIYELKRLNQTNGGHFFRRATMRFWKDTIKGYGMRKLKDGTIFLYRKRNPAQSWHFNSNTGLCIGSFSLSDKD